MLRGTTEGGSRTHLVAVVAATWRQKLGLQMTSTTWRSFSAVASFTPGFHSCSASLFSLSLHCDFSAFFFSPSATFFPFDPCFTPFPFDCSHSSTTVFKLDLNVSTDTGDTNITPQLCSVQRGRGGMCVQVGCSSLLWCALYVVACSTRACFVNT